MTEAHLLFTGGIDSTACAHFLLHKGFKVNGLYIDYGQESAPNEIKASKEISKLLGFSHNIVNIKSAGKQFTKGEILGRNAFLVFSAYMFSEIKSGLIVLGIHDASPYYDCSDRFIKAIDGLISEYSNGSVNVFVPFLEWRKPDIINYCKCNSIPINMTISCEAGAKPGCGICMSCKEREFLNVG